MQVYNNLRLKISGLTIIELFLAIAITGIVSAGLFSVFNTSMTSWSRFRERENLSLNGKVFLDKITYGLRVSKKITEIGKDYIIFKSAEWEDYSIKYYFDEGKNAIYEVSEKTGYRPMAIVENVSSFNLSTYNNLMIISLKLKTKNTSVTCRTAVTKRISAL